MSRILYLSCHSILEYDEVKLFHDMGHQVFSPGAYVEPANPGNPFLRPGIADLKYDEDVLAQFHKIGGEHPGEDGKDYLTKEFVDNFDVVICMHMPRWITKNWEAMKHKPVIWRTIGQSISSTEAELAPYRRAGLKIVRYSPMEDNIPGFIGSDALIRFYKDPCEYSGWNGKEARVITFAQHMQRRASACNYNLFEEATRPFPRLLCGPGSETDEATGEPRRWGTGEVPYTRLKEEMRNNRAYFYTGTHPASYTLNFIEAWMTGIPIVAIGSDKGNAHYFLNHNLYEIPQLIQHEYSGFISNNVNHLQFYVDQLLQNPELAQLISANGRAAAIRLFGRDQAVQGWDAMLRKL